MGNPGVYDVEIEVIGEGTLSARADIRYKGTLPHHVLPAGTLLYQADLGQATKGNKCKGVVCCSCVIPTAIVSYFVVAVVVGLLTRNKAAMVPAGLGASLLSILCCLCCVRGINSNEKTLTDKSINNAVNSSRQIIDARIQAYQATAAPQSIEYSSTQFGIFAVNPMLNQQQGQCIMLMPRQQV